jgi:AraC family transcriptional regulator
MHTRALAIPGFCIHSGLHTGGTQLPRHSHDDPTLCFLLSGRFTEYSRNAATDCVTGTMKLMPAGELHWNQFIAPETRGVRVDISRKRFADHRAINALLDEHRVITSDGPRSLMRRLIAELQVADDAASMVVEGLLLELLGTLSREHAARGTDVPHWLQRADDIVRAHFATHISLARVANNVGVAPATLARSYRATYQVSIGERVRQLRLDQAARELIEGAEPISMIAANAGFYDQSHFTSAFRRRYAMTPARFRQLRSAGAVASRGSS